MFFSFFKRPINSRQRVYRVPAGERIYAIGDVHGRADLLRTLQDQILQDARQSPRVKSRVVYLGDYVDRGPSVRETLDLVVDGLRDDFEVTCLRGNHEQLLLDFLEDPTTLPAWVALGGLWTLRSYGVPCNRASLQGTQAAQELRQALSVSLPEAHFSLLSTLPVYQQIGDYLFVHAGVRPGVALERQAREDCLWIRNEFLDSHHGLACMVVHGHTIISYPEFHFGRLAIDTGAYATGVLTCAVFESTGVRYLQTGAAQ